jgi:hypothetical protein
MAKAPVPVLPPDPHWTPSTADFAHWKTQAPYDLWRADKGNSWRNLDNQVVLKPLPAVAPCGGYAVFEWQANGTWKLIEDHCGDNCTPPVPQATDEPMPEGLQISLPC